MGFFNGRVTFVRYRVNGDSPLPFDEHTLDRAQRHMLGKHGTGEPVDGVLVGWAGGEHVLDLEFDLAKNIVEDCLHLAIRVDTDKVPGDLLRAYTQMEINARAELNPSGFATKAQKLEAKEAAIARAEAEAADGRFRRRKHYPVLWDGISNTLYAGTASASVLDRLVTLFHETFDAPLVPLTAGSLAYQLAESRGAERMVEDFGPVGFIGHDAPLSIAWTGDDASSRDFWGNEFLVWLWHTLQNSGDTIVLPDGSDVTVMLAKTLTLDCPRGENGTDNLRDEGPTRLPEAMRALQSGKLPRKVGLILVRHGAQYELTFQAESLAVSGLALPKAEGVTGHEARIARVEALRHLVETMDLLYDAYGRRRTGPEWSGELGRIRRWLTAA